jgi:hypothetical protein
MDTAGKIKSQPNFNSQVSAASKTASSACWIARPAGNPVYRLIQASLKEERNASYRKAL